MNSFRTFWSTVHAQLLHFGLVPRMGFTSAYLKRRWGNSTSRTCKQKLQTRDKFIPNIGSDTISRWTGPRSCLMIYRTSGLTRLHGLPDRGIFCRSGPTIPTIFNSSAATSCTYMIKTNGDHRMQTVTVKNIIILQWDLCKLNPE